MRSANWSPNFRPSCCVYCNSGSSRPWVAKRRYRSTCAVIAATNSDLAQMVCDGRFRADRYYRLNVVALQTVPLKDRREDIDDLIEHFLDRLASLMRATATFAALPKMYAFVGLAGQRPRAGKLRRANHIVGQRSRKLCGAAARIARSYFSCRTARLSRRSCAAPDSSDASGNAMAAASARSHSQATCWPTLADAQRADIFRTLEKAGYNQSLAARLLDISRQQLLRKITQLELPVLRVQRGCPPKKG